MVPAPGTRGLRRETLSATELLRWAQVFLHAVVAGEAEYETEATKYRSC